MNLRIKYKSRIPGFFGADAIVLYPYIFFKHEKESIPHSLFKHEMSHVRDFENDGIIWHYIKYFAESLWQFIKVWSIRQAYFNNRFEVRARNFEKSSLTEHEKARLGI